MSKLTEPAVPVIVRPRYHVTAPRNWLNDPNGLIKRDGRYHLFYQYNPDAPVWAAPLWGHVSSADLVHWTDHPPALVPRPNGPDRDGCWSGCARMIDGRPTIFYTGVVEADGRRVESVCVAHGSADLLHWEAAAEPLIAAPPPEITGGYHRDPFVFGSPGAWRMLIGSGLSGDSGRSGAVLHYASTDGADWAYRGVLLQRPAGAGPTDTGPMWECPQVFRSEGLDVLIFSVQMEDEPDPLRHCVYAVGTLGDTSFELRSMDRIDYGNVFYAPAITCDDDGRVLMWGWVQEKHGRLDVDHAGALSLPRVVDLHDGRLRVAPAPELVALRGPSLNLGEMADGDWAALDGIPAVLGSFELEARVPAGHRAELALWAADRIVYRLIVDDGLGLAVVESGSFGPFEAPLPPRAANQRSIRLFVDGSLMELFIDDEVALTTRCYEEPPTRITAHGSGAVVLSHVVVHGLDAAMSARAA